MTLRTYTEKILKTRRRICERAIDGDARALGKLRTEASWFRVSAANPRRDPNMKPAEDGEIVLVAREYLAQHGGQR